MSESQFLRVLRETVGIVYTEQGIGPPSMGIVSRGTANRPSQWLFHVEQPSGTPEVGNQTFACFT
jgi:hypothetical protein